MKKHRAKQGVHMTLYILHTGGAVFQLSSPRNLQHTVPMGLFLMISLYNPPVSKFLKSKSAYRAKEAKVNTFFEDMQLVSKAVKNNSCQTVIPTTKRDC